jgi:hypothetical protein
MEIEVSSRSQLQRSTPGPKSTTGSERIPEKMQLHSKECRKGCPTNCAKSPKSGQSISCHLPTLIFIIYGLFKMSSGSTVLDLDPELMNMQNFDFAKPKLFFKNITSTYIHERILFNFTNVFNTKQAITDVYQKLLDQHEEPFKLITKSVMDVSPAIIEGSLEDFHDIIKALPQKSEISMPGQPK